MKVACDLDGVVVDIMPQIKEVANQRGIQLEFKEYEPINVDKAVFHDIVHTVLAGKMNFIKPYPDAEIFLSLIFENIGPITFVTARNEKYNNNTLDWIATHFSFPYKVVNQHSSDKAEFIKSEGFDAFIEDRLRTANHAAELGINTYLLNRSWNIKRYTHERVKRVDSIKLIYLDLLRMKNKKIEINSILNDFKYKD